MKMLEAIDISFSYGKRLVLKQINLTLREGELVLLTGANGCGKTTLLKLLSGLLPFQEGQILYNKKKVSQKELRDLTGYVFHNPFEQIFNFTVEHEIAFGLENTGVERQRMLKIVDETLEFFKLNSVRFKDPGTLSCGQAQRVAIASIVVLKPKFLFLDEPTAMLDDEGCKQVKDCLKALLEEGIGIVVATHEPAFFSQLVSTVVHMSFNSVDFVGSFDQFKSKGFEDVEI
ncbi:energy-coupling factor ABC transporter ATP-binding protein [Pseudothermotoga thermarum]|uniref:ABC transporter related protein n=1 Tax=Pseudothermotoga thermarum DSM 5069 TaxID=688269 RepID=F7YWJ2_9THEM|nr:ABC transporter ATP-binding protein [Pseudothermotoga thermarum]AEH51973.1 ABC transporter related protein [Pseudothermotoga thermarum DSM 5069]